MIKNVDIERVSDLIRAVAAEEIRPRFQSLGKEDIHIKSHPGDLVTEADVQAERQLTARLPALLAGSVVVGEEAVFAEPEVINALFQDAPVWVVDPVDGTSNFARGDARFACMVALVHGGKTIAGWIYDVVQDVMWAAEQGSGVYRQQERITLCPDVTMPLAEMAGSLGPKPYKPTRSRFSHWLRHGSAAHDYIALMQGRMQFVGYNRLMPWDHAAGSMMYVEAGGVTGLLSGDAYRPTIHQGYLLMAQTAELWTEVQGLVLEEHAAKASS
jgi:fructose-1,6-bisphosphatase/inositol monophosphatase family enzyme